MRKILVIIIVICLLPFAFYATYGIGLTLLGYELGQSPEELAQKLVEQDRPANDCNLFRTMDVLMRPTTDELQARCIRVYARLKKDPSACELLMPSSYGLSCVGGAEEHLPCDVTSIQYSVYWKDGDKENTESIKSCLLSNEKRTTLGNACCEVAKVAFLKENNDCSVLKNNRPVYDHCLYALAWKNKDPDICSDMTEGNPKTACIVQSTALKQDPSICQGCTQPLEKLEDLK